MQIFLLDSLKIFLFQPLNFGIQLTLTVLYNDLGETFTTSQYLSKNNPENKISLQSSVTPTPSQIYVHSKSLIHIHPQMRGRKVYSQEDISRLWSQVCLPSRKGLAASWVTFTCIHPFPSNITCIISFCFAVPLIPFKMKKLKHSFPINRFLHLGIFPPLFSCFFLHS